ncbi:MAG: acyl carrier protein, partial [Victivallales bacterium]
MTDEDEVFKGVRACLLETLDKDSIEVRKEDRLINDLGIDSLDLIHLVFTLEQHFGIKISLREIDRRIKGKLGAIPLEVD